jgi:iron complex transport system permease protein
LGDETAAGLGADVKSIRRRLILISSFVTAMAVAFCGIVGFVGLISPHVVRRLQGPDYRMLLPASALFGGLFLVLADDLASSVLSGGGILPVGVITAFVGAPFFLWILNRRLRGRAV